ncbi:helix-turn-helix transcriptional regulator [Actinomadura kijaniata]|uniref:helix-turn-helix transcriptional regulator n=1 Tax=Actinomadura kijaniata TaxID=46161 RepID=UPI000831F081|nr:helix-turn-helix domain-containing protein [Actinomadura kijaniata]
MSHTGEALLTVSQVCAELKISRSTFFEWRRRGHGPVCVLLPGGRLRIRRSALDGWLAALQSPIS